MRELLYSIACDKREDFLAKCLRIPLWMASCVYGLAVRFILVCYKIGILQKKRLPVAVISIGNITLGGVGKTPMTIFIARKLK